MAFRAANFPVIIDSQGESTNPVATTVMADTGALTSGTGGYTLTGGGVYEVLVVASATALAEFAVQRRNAANGANVGDVQIFYVAASGCVSVPFRFEAENGERFRVVMNANLTGDAVANITAQRVA